MLAQVDISAVIPGTAVVLFGLFVRTLVNTLRYIAAWIRGEVGAKSSTLTQFTAYGAGLVAVFLFGASDFGAGIPVAGVTLAHIGPASKVILGLLVASLGGTVTDVIKGVDRHQSAAVPSLVAEAKAPEQ